jgi:uncharacterized membrane protein
LEGAGGSGNAWVGDRGGAEKVSSAGTQTGLAPNLAGVLCYVLGWITGIVFYLVEKDPFVRFHALQSILTFGGITVLYLVVTVLLPAGLWPLWLLFRTLGVLIWLGSLVLWVLLMIKAYRGERYKLPLVGDLAERYATR